MIKQRERKRKNYAKDLTGFRNSHGFVLEEAAVKYLKKNINTGNRNN